MPVLTFETDTVGQAPAGLTAQAGTLEVINDALMGSKAVQLSAVASLCVATIDGFAGAVDSFDIIYCTPTSGATFLRGGIRMGYDDIGDQGNASQNGYILLWDYQGGAGTELRPMKQVNGEYSAIAAAVPIPATTGYRYRTTWSTDGLISTITLYTWNGSVWAQAHQWTDATYVADGFCGLQTFLSPGSVFDDVEVVVESSGSAAVIGSGYGGLIIGA